jgi:hypothetical protein
MVRVRVAHVARLEPVMSDRHLHSLPLLFQTDRLPLITPQLGALSRWLAK